jgi:hypothetical protein
MGLCRPGPRALQSRLVIFAGVGLLCTFVFFFFDDHFQRGLRHQVKKLPDFFGVHRHAQD